jgi:hypothetical protein
MNSKGFPDSSATVSTTQAVLSQLDVHRVKDIEQKQPNLKEE